MPYGSKVYANYSNSGDYWQSNSTYGVKCSTENIDKRPLDGLTCTGRVLEEGAMNY